MRLPLPQHPLLRRAVLGGGALVVSAVLAATIVPAVAASPTASPSPSAAAPGQGHRPGGPAMVAVRALIQITAKDTGQTPQQVQQALQSGKSIDDIAGSKAPQIKTDALAALKTALDKRVAAGKLTSSQETTILAAAPAMLDKAMASHDLDRMGGPGDARGMRAVFGTLVKTTATDTGQTPEQVTQALRGGKSIDDIAGSKAAQVKSDTLAGLKTRLDKAVAAGRMTSDQETALLNGAAAYLDTIMASHDAIPAMPPGGGRHHGGPGAPPAPTPTP